MEYHAHIYWKNEEERQRAISLKGDLIEMKCLIGVIHDETDGPHPLPMYQIRYTDKNKQQVELFLKMKTSKMSVLLHESINDDIRDHTEGARWIGIPLNLNLEWFKNTQKREDRRKL